MLGKLRHLKDPPWGAANAGAGDQHQRIPLAVDFVVEIYVVDFDFAAFDRLESLHKSASELAPASHELAAVTLSNRQILSILIYPLAVKEELT